MFDIYSILVVFVVSGSSVLIHEFLIRKHVSTKGNRLFFYFIFFLLVLALSRPHFITQLNFSGNGIMLNLGEFTDSVKPSGKRTFHLKKIVITIYLIVVFFGLARMTTGIVKVIRLIKRSSPGNQQYVRWVHVSNFQPFTFFNYILIPRKIPKDLYSSVYEHERYHVRQMHSIDMLLWGLLRIVFWFDPFIHLLRKKQALNLEYDTDGHMVKTIQKDEYCEHLLSSTFTSDLGKIGIYPMFNTSNIYLRIKRLRKIPVINKLRSNLTLLVTFTLLLTATVLSKASFLPKARTQNSELLSEPKFSPRGFEHYIDSVIQKRLGNRFDNINKDFYLQLSLNIVIDDKGRVIKVSEESRNPKPGNENTINEYASSLLIETIQNMPNWIPAQANGKSVQSSIKKEFLFVGGGEQ